MEKYMYMQIKVYYFKLNHQHHKLNVNMKDKKLDVQEIK